MTHFWVRRPAPTARSGSIADRLIHWSEVLTRATGTRLDRLFLSAPSPQEACCSRNHATALQASRSLRQRLIVGRPFRLQAGLPAGFVLTLSPSLLRQRSVRHCRLRKPLNPLYIRCPFPLPPVFTPAGISSTVWAIALPRLPTSLASRTYPSSVTPTLRTPSGLFTPAHSFRSSYSQITTVLGSWYGSPLPRILTCLAHSPHTR